MNKPTDHTTSAWARCRIQDRVQSLVRFFTLLTIATTLFSFAANQSWLADLLANLRLQQILGGGILAVLCLLGKDIRFAALASGCILVTSIAILPPQRHLSPSEGPKGNAGGFTVMTINALTTNQNHNEISTQILEAGPDVVAVLELSTSLADHLRQRLAEQYRHFIQHASDQGNFGIGVWSRTPMNGIDRFQLNEPILSISAEIDGIQLIATHPLPPIGQRNWQSRNEHLRQLAARVSNLRKQHPSRPVIVLGDLNLTPWSPVFLRFQTQSQLFRAAPRWSFKPTWYVIDDWFPMGLILDHVLATEDLTFEQYTVGDAFGSDHRSVSVRFRRLPAKG